MLNLSNFFQKKINVINGFDLFTYQRKLTSFYSFPRICFLLTVCGLLSGCHEPIVPEKQKKEIQQDSLIDPKELADSTNAYEIVVLEGVDSQQKIDREIIEATAVISEIDASGVKGVAKFLKTNEGVKVIADIQGLKPGKHGFHIHEFGDCSGKGGEFTGTHYNPTAQKHGKPSNEDSHIGDLGNLMANEQGNAHYEATYSTLKLQGRYSILGRSVVVHANPDDYVTQPTGDSGSKIGCGVIQPGSFN